MAPYGDVAPVQQAVIHLDRESSPITRGILAVLKVVPVGNDIPIMFADVDVGLFWKCSIQSTALW